MQQKIAMKEKEQKEENLRMMAQRAREERSGVVVQPRAGKVAGKVGGTMGGAIAGYGSDSESDDGKASTRGGGESESEEEEEEEVSEGETEQEKMEARERAKERQERRKERERELRMNNMGTEQRAKVLAKLVFSFSLSSLHFPLSQFRFNC